MSERLVALAFLAASGLYLAGALSLPRGEASRPGPGFFPVAVGVFLSAVAVAFVVSTFRTRAVPDGSDTEAAVPGAWARVATTSAGLVGFCVLLPWAGYPLAAFVFLELLLKRLGGGGWTPALAMALLATALSYYLFAVLLSVPLPRGLLLD